MYDLDISLMSGLWFEKVNPWLTVLVPGTITEDFMGLNPLVWFCESLSLKVRLAVPGLSAISFYNLY